MMHLFRSGTHHRKTSSSRPGFASVANPSERRAAPPETRLNPQVLPKTKQVAVDKHHRRTDVKVNARCIGRLAFHECKVMDCNR